MSFYLSSPNLKSLGPPCQNLWLDEVRVLDLSSPTTVITAFEKKRYMM